MSKTVSGSILINVTAVACNRHCRVFLLLCLLYFLFESSFFFRENGLACFGVCELGLIVHCFFHALSFSYVLLISHIKHRKVHFYLFFTTSFWII